VLDVVLRVISIDVLRVVVVVLRVVVVDVVVLRVVVEVVVVDVEVLLGNHWTQTGLVATVTLATGEFGHRPELASRWKNATRFEF